MRILRYIPLFLLLTLWSCQDEFPIKGTVNSMEELTPSKYCLTPYMYLMAQSGEAHEMQGSITHNTSWIITGLPSWLTITPSQGTGEGPTFVTIAFAENTTGDVRSCKFYLKSNDGKVSVPIEASQFSTTSSQTTEDISNFCPDNNHPHQIDLGLSVKWTCCNVGASSPADYGGYYAWGETAEKVNYTWTTYKWCGGSDKSMTKYCTSSYYGTVDDKSVLEASDDAATVNWGSPYRTPTSDELTELQNYCTWTWVTIGGVPGHKVTGSTGNSIFLPAGGFRSDTRLLLKEEYGYYWASTLGDVYPAGAQQLGFTSDKPYRNGSERYHGNHVRPVVGGPYLKTSVDKLTFSSKSTTQTAVINTNQSFSISTSDTWLTVTPTSGTLDTTIEITPATNTSTEERTATITISYLTQEAVITVVQSGINANPLGLCPDGSHPHMIDLGLSVLWSCCNLGATSPEEYGKYYAWGETSEKSNCDWTTYKWCQGTETKLTKYCNDSQYGTVDNKTSLELSDDVVRANMGSPYRTPTIDELSELCDQCEWNLTTINNIKGYKVTGSNDNSIFLPMAGYQRLDSPQADAENSGRYASSSLCTTMASYIYYLYFNSSEHNTQTTNGNGSKSQHIIQRSYGLPFRPVRPATTR